jgi:hypothetical protein
VGDESRLVGVLDMGGLMDGSGWIFLDCHVLLVTSASVSVELVRCAVGTAAQPAFG